MSELFDVVVLGAGPAGTEAAIGARRHGHSVALIDEQPGAGGQVWRAPLRRQPGRQDAELRAGNFLRSRLAESGIPTFFNHRIWSVTRESGFRVDALGPDGTAAFTARALVAATGTHERIVPFPGWTLPGVVGLAATTILLKSHGAAPGKRVLVAGCGPLLAAVAAGLVKAGAKVVAVADMAPRAAWLKSLPAIARRPELAARGAAWAAKILAAGIPVFSAHNIRRAEGRDQVERVVIGPVDANGAEAEGKEHSFDIGALVVGHGLTSSCEVTRLLRAEHRFDRMRGGWVPVTDERFETSVPGLYAIGDGAGLRGADAAVLAGQRVAVDLGFANGALQGEDAAAGARSVDRALQRLCAFSDAMAGLMAQRPAQVGSIPPDTIICRCEDVTRAEIDAAVDDGARDASQLKHFTRCGMGPCQGRYCGDNAQELLAQRLGITREAAGYWTGRPPLRPVPLSGLLGDFDYADIPIPKPAPL